MNLARTYDTVFFETMTEGSRPSARRILPLVLSWLQVRSAVDIGCGSGAWLAELRQRGVEHVLGIDGHALRAEQLYIPFTSFERRDLRRRLEVERTFDLALSMEVAEHLPRSRAASFVEDLTRLSPHVLFSAAIPFQRGTHHVNCQWPDYWQALFARHNYVALDLIRPEVWDDRTVEFWFRQNSVLYVDRQAAERNPAFAAALAQADVPLTRRVHPALWERWNGFSVREVLRLVPQTIAGAVARRLSPGGAGR